MPRPPFALSRTRAARLLRDVTGANLVEAALVTPLLVVMTFAIVDFGGLFYVYLALENGVSQATRYGITGNQMADPEDEGELLSREESMKTAMRDATPTLTIDDGAFTFSHLPVGGSTWQSGPGDEGDIAKVTVNYTWPILTPVMRPFFDNGEIRLTVESAMKNEGRFN